MRTGKYYCKNMKYRIKLVMMGCLKISTAMLNGGNILFCQRLEEKNVFLICSVDIFILSLFLYIQNLYT